ncbi:RES family NAD+ phosphorylase [Spirosoma aureum]|uniref:RES family NAD+ phosphorylase n=1 Tax=Spirosoma aureum TaxID=2692134 RepID=A0A6G9ATW1_9BACT|nr:RES family NAD+ phosphorylase [Spirosoma aureum]QIP15715.1 RES family NAD+ phosphorylase [Spirosoma aureum]
MGTIQVYRLQKSKHNSTTLLGTGAKLSGGRWNVCGTPLIYTAASTSLAILEVRVHLGILPTTKYPPLNMVVIELPEECIYEFYPSDLPDDWNEVPASDCCQQFLAPFLEPGNKLAFSVPSAVNPFERNILINPLHSDIRRVFVREFYPFTMDSRLFQDIMV